VEWLTGNNVVYRREAVAKHLALLDAGQWENALHDALRAEGVKLWCDPQLVIGHKKHYSFGEYFSQRYLYARSSRARACERARQRGSRGRGSLCAAAAVPRTVQRILARARTGLSRCP
jgi:hypothetical protein